MTRLPQELRPMSNDGHVSANGRDTIRAHRDASVVSRVSANVPGHDHVLVHAVDVTTGQVRRATAAI